MLYVVIEAERARLKKLYKENELITPKSRLVPEDKRGSRAEQYGVNVLGQRFTKEPVSSHAQSLVQDSEWFMLSPQEKLAWAKVSKDPRIAAAKPGRVRGGSAETGEESGAGPGPWQGRGRVAGSRYTCAGLERLAAGPAEVLSAGARVLGSGGFLEVGSS
ncbi:hypothetical protein AB1E18_016693 [Capra hircus]